MIDPRELYSIIQERYGNPATFIRRVKATMAEHEISQAALARRAGYSATNVSRWLNGLVTPSLETMLILDEALAQLVRGPE